MSDKSVSTLFITMTIIELDHDHHFKNNSKVLYCCSNGGLFSNFYHTYWSIADLKNRGITPNSIDFSKGFGLFRGQSVDRDLYGNYFQADESQITIWQKYKHSRSIFPRLDHHGVYATYPYGSSNIIMRSYFQPSNQIKEIVEQFKNKYSLEKGGFHGLYYRGTDKGTEVKLPDVDSMLNEMDKTLKNSSVKVLVIQTDQAEVLARALERFPHAIVLDELPVINGTQGFHFENEREEIIEPLLFSMRLLAMTCLLAEAKSIVLPTSNLAAWICLLRGNCLGVLQFDKYGKPVTPLRAILYRLKNRLRLLRARILGSNVVYE